MTRWLMTLLLLLAPWSAHAQDELTSSDIIADVSSRHIAVTAGFSGADTTLFGALPEDGDVLLTVTGPQNDVVVRRKERVLGVWLNRSSVEFSRVPGFYWFAASRSLSDIAPEAWLSAQRIGSPHLRFNVSNATDYREIPNFLSAMVDLRLGQGLFMAQAAPVVIMGKRLYRADVHIPADAPTGEYTVTTYLLQKGQLVGTQTTTLTLRKEGSMASISAIAEKNPISYALLALALALLTGWTSAVLMQRS